MEIEIDIFGTRYMAHVVEQPGRAQGTRFKAYGTFEGKHAQGQGASRNAAIEDMKAMAQVLLN